MYINIGMDKDVVYIYIYIMAYYSLQKKKKRNKIVTFVEKWLELKTVKQNEVSQRKINIVH